MSLQSALRQTVRTALRQNVTASTSRSFVSTSHIAKDGSRTSPGQTPVKGERPHPGYTSYETPATSADPKDIPGAPQGAKPSGTTPTASTRQAPPHPEVHQMAKGGEEHGSDAITPEEKTTKNWGPNSRTPEFNQREGRRNPVLHGESNEAKGPPS